MIIIHFEKNRNFINLALFNQQFKKKKEAVPFPPHTSSFEF